MDPCPVGSVVLAPRVILAEHRSLAAVEGVCRRWAGGGGKGRAGEGVALPLPRVAGRDAGGGVSYVGEHQDRALRPRWRGIRSATRHPPLGAGWGGGRGGLGECPQGRRQATSNHPCRRFRCKEDHESLGPCLESPIGDLEPPAPTIASSKRNTNPLAYENSSIQPLSFFRCLCTMLGRGPPPPLLTLYLRCSRCAPSPPAFASQGGRGRSVSTPTTVPHSSPRAAGYGR
jgi:hypothetical protein